MSVQSETDIVEAISRYFNRKHRGKARMFYGEATKLSGNRIDLLFVQGREDCIHVIEAEPSLSRVWDGSHGFAQLGKHRGNYKWLAIPWDVYEEDRRNIRKESKKRCIGLLLVSGRERFTVREKLKCYRKGTFLHVYPKAYEEWHQT